MITSYDTMPLAAYEQVRAILRNDALDDADVTSGLIAALTDTSVEAVDALPIGDYAALAASLHFLSVVPQPSGKRPPKKMDIGGVRFILTLDPGKLTAAQFIDFQEFNDKGDLVGVVATCLIPEGCTYNRTEARWKGDKTYEPEDVRDIVRRWVTVQEAVDIVDFFQRRSVRSVMRSLSYLERSEMLRPWRKGSKERLAKIRAAKASLRDGAGLLRLMKSRKSPGRPGR